jgi:TRAP-type C4-dicarboxylate transport system permease small subunit
MDRDTDPWPGPEPDSRERRRHPVLRYVEVAEQIIGALALLIIFVLVLTQALQRYLPVTGWAWTGELAQYCLVWMTFSLVGYLFGRGEHITLQLVDNLSSATARRLVQAFACLAVAVISVGFVIEGWALVSDDSGQVSPALQMPLVWLYWIPLVGFALAAIRAVLGIFLPWVASTPTNANEAD